MPTFYVNNLAENCDGITGNILGLLGGCRALKDYGFRKDELGQPVIEDCLKNNFIKYYTSPEVASSFEGLYYNMTVQDRFVDYWDVISKRFAKNQYVIGYDPINEPWPANFYKDISLMYNIHKFDKEVLFPLLKRVHNVIR